MKAALVESHRERIARIESGEQVLVGVNRFTRDRAVAADRRRGGRDPRRRPRGRGRAGRGAGARGAPARDEAAVRAALDGARARGGARTRTSCPRRSPRPAPGSTTGEWAQCLRDAFGSYRAPTGVGEAAAPPSGEERRRAARRGRAAWPSSSAAG